MTASEPELRFSGQSEVVTDFCFELTNKDSRLSNSHLDDFSNKTDLPCTFGEENQFTMHSCSAVQVNPSISFDKNYRERKKYPKIFGISMGEMVDSGVPSNSKANKDKILLTIYGICVIRIHSNNISWSSEETDKFITNIRSLRKKQKRKAKKYFNIFVSYWNKNLDLPDISTDSSVKDKHTITFIKNPSIMYNESEYPISSIFENTQNKSGSSIDDNYHIRKQIVGISMLSRMWREYTASYVDEALDRDLSGTTNEFQLLNSTHSLILRDENGLDKNSHSDVEFDDYFTDMVFGIENYLIIRSSIAVLEEKINQEINEFFEKNNALHPIESLEYEKNVRRFSQWIIEIKEWKYISRYGLTHHFHTFLEEGYTRLRVNQWLDEAEERIGFLRELHHSRWKRITKISSIVISIGLLTLTIALLYLNLI